MNDPQSIQFLWRYMVDADARIMEAAETVDDAGYRLEQGISFGSLEKLLNHAMLAQRSWLERLRGNDVAYVDKPPLPRREFRERWTELGRELLEFSEAQTADSLQGIVRSRNRAGRRFELIRWAVMFHVADHATYHRGQINSMIKRAGGKPSAVMLYSYSVGQGFGREIE